MSRQADIIEILAWVWRGLSKLRAITDEYLISKGIDQKVPPLSILDDEFLDELSRKKS